MKTLINLPDKSTHHHYNV